MEAQFLEDRRVLSRSLAQTRWVLATFGLVLFIGVIDYLTGFELSLLVFYLLPICLAVAAVGWRFGIVASVASIASWLIGDFAAGARFARPFISAWITRLMVRIARELSRRVNAKSASCPPTFIKGKRRRSCRAREH